ncbi:hypothetical protein CDAR_536311 [Caerostris darwini]|uniref:Uncharacterized protein n=1 Tax=Caerostris darwini TaxID=1538125 RepID=A0AAV4WHH6_9ARAC|nr:hypothetical protein CDAR_536311 [Caerostris darwini]
MKVSILVYGNLHQSINLSAKKIVDVATYCAAYTFNEGFTAILKIMDVMGLKSVHKRNVTRDESIRTPMTPKRPEQLGKKLNPKKQKNMSEQKGYCMVLV